MVTIHRFKPNDPEVSTLYQSLTKQLYPTAQLPDLEVNSLCIGHLVAKSSDAVHAFTSVFFNPEMSWEGQAVLCIGNLEMHDGEYELKLLFDELEKWGQELGIAYLVGPMNGSTWSEYRLPLANEHPAFFTERLRKNYYPVLLEQVGMTLISTYFSAVAECNEIGERNAELAQIRLSELNLRWSEIDLGNPEQAFREIHTFCLEAFRSNVLYTHIGEAEFVQRYSRMVPYMNQRYILMVRDAQNTLVGLLFALPNHLCKTEFQLVVKTLAVSEEYRQKGVASAIGAIYMNRAAQGGCTKVFHAFIQEQNNSSILSDRYKGTIYRKYGLWSKAINLISLRR